ncbi:MAG: membrane protein insertase YidC [Cytophagaceae bacterium]|nr:membrane protein insertase YidC [Cytophagaceae bacterium]
MERNQAIGLVLITVIMVGYLTYMSTQQQEIQTETPQQVEKKTEGKKTITETTPVVSDSALTQQWGSLSAAAKGDEKRDSLANSDISVTFNSKGGLVESVLLKKYLTDSKKPLYLVDKDISSMSYMIATNEGEKDLAKLFYVPVKTDSSISYKATVGQGQYIEHKYTLPKSGYVLKYELKLIGLSNIVKDDMLTLKWNAHLPKVEKDLIASRDNSTINYYYADGSDYEFDYLPERSKDEETQKLNKPVKWISMKQKFFSSALIAQNNFKDAYLKSTTAPEEDTVGVKDLEATIQIPVSDLKSGKGNYQFYFGPNQYDILKGVTDKFEKNLFLGWPVINWINRFIVVPVFHFLEQYISNYGIIIIILVILLKLILFPLSYKSYMSMAKMKVLKPEIDAIKEKNDGDLQKTQMDTMDLYRKVGINPLSGCIPILLQMPVLLAMFNFFPNSIELRQEAFLWADDLSTYDAPIWLPFKIPFYGSHVSVFTLLMTISTLVYTWFNNQVSTVTGPMKSVSYIMPVVFMFVLNSFPAGLSFYYFVSNIVTIFQQIIIRRFVDEDKIRLALEENKKKIAANPNKKSRWMTRLEEAMKAKEEEAKKKRKK